MAYASQADIQNAIGGPERLVELADWDNDGAVDPDVIARGQAAADGWIDGYLRLRYATPIAAPTATLVLLAADEAIYQIRKSRGMLGPEDHKQRETREREMEAYRRGELRPDDPLPAPSTAVRAKVVPACGAVTRDGTKGMW
jgi:phage gp36-like protein